MKQIVENIKIEVIDSAQMQAKKTLIDTQIILDRPTFENSGQISIPKGPPCEFYEVKDVNYLMLMSTVPFDMMINNMVLINTSQFSFINRTKRITVSIQCNPYHETMINFVYGELKYGNRDVAAKLTQPNFGTRWDRVLKNIVIDSNDQNTVDMAGSYPSEYSKFIHYSEDDKYQFGLNPNEVSSRLQPCLNVTPKDSENETKISHIII